MDVRKRLDIHIVVIALAVLAAMLLLAAPSSALAKKPAPVTVIKATPSYNSITLDWKASKGAQSYEIYRCDWKYGIYQKIDMTDITSYTDSRLQTGEAWWYKIRAVNEYRKSAKSPRISAAATLEAPTLKARASGEGIYLTLGAAAGADGYVIYRDGKSLGAQEDLTCLDKEVYADKRHRYRAVAYRYIEGRKVVASAFSNEVAAIRPSLNISLKGDSEIPDTLHEGEDLELKGTISSNTTIHKVAVGLVDKETNKWIKEYRYFDSDLDDTEFDLAEANDKVSFEDLELGAYYYRVEVTLKAGGKKTLTNQAFEVIEPPGADKILEKALECAWPYGTSRSKCHYPDGIRTEAYTEALTQAYGSRSGWGRQTAAGASCDVFVGTVIRASGYDTGFPRGLDDVAAYCRKHTDKWENLGALSEEDIKPGDVIYQIYKSGVGHVCIYVGDGHVANAHYYGKSYGIVEKFSSKVKSASRCREFNVYRPIQ